MLNVAIICKYGSDSPCIICFKVTISIKFHVLHISVLTDMDRIERKRDIPLSVNLQEEDPDDP